ncbi:hypothetical protein COO60DRAFT_1235754 [Scenedesmus sp. NREL 46B-D3]|nr:hypothetical protein COO60DRAFT_1235754 [Scenedesmus sp. NREL 46B-D3]
MAPKKGQADKDLTGEELQAQQQHTKLLKQAVAKGVISEQAVQSNERLPLCKALVRSDGKDIVKKSTIRKNRYLMLFNCKIAPAAAGPMGTLARLDSRNPVFYMNFPSGRLKFTGTLAFPANKYLVLRLGGGPGGALLAEDVFDNMIVFSEAVWVGSPEDNPSEAPLPLPKGLAGALQHEGAADYGYGAGHSAWLSCAPIITCWRIQA